MIPVERLPDFIADYEARFGWYLREGGEAIALRFEAAVEESFIRLSRQPTLGRVRRFPHPKLFNLRSFAVCKPFDKNLIFYRSDGNMVVMWRLIHGARDLGRRLLDLNN
jgi:plasmid stabilization system protein ParE